MNVIKVPSTLMLTDGRYFLKERRPLLQMVIDQAKILDVPVQTMLRLGRSVPEAITKTVTENASDMIVFGWPGVSGSNEKLFGSVIDHVIANPPTDIAIVRLREMRPFNRILVPVAGGPNGRLALTTAIALARNTPEQSQVVLLHVTLPDIDETTAQARAENAFRRAYEGNSYGSVEKLVVAASSPLEGILTAAADSDLIVIGATKESLFRNLLMGNVAHQVAEQAKVPVIIVKRRSSAVAAVLRETILPPILRSAKLR